MLNEHITFYDSRWSQQVIESRVDFPRASFVVNKIVQLAQRTNTQHIIDVGCGNGWILSQLAAKIGSEAKLHGIEPSSIGTENAQRQAPQALITCDTLYSYQQSQCFDIVICSEVIEHVEDQHYFACRLIELLSPGGYLVVTTPNGRYRKGYFECPRRAASIQPIENWLTQKQLRNILRQHATVTESGTFDPSYFYSTSKAVNAAMRTLLCIKGGWRAWDSSIAPLFCGMGYGLYQFAIARRK